MKVLFMGTPEFAVVSLDALMKANHTVCGVITQPDKPKNRGHKVSFSPVKEYAINHELPVYQPLRMRDEDAYQLITELDPDCIVVAAYGQFLPNRILEYPKYGCINVHSSLLPKYRGAAPINWSILNGDKETGVSIMYMSSELDAGDIINTISTVIEPNENALELTQRLSLLGAEALIHALDNVEKGIVSRTVQDESKVTLAPRLDKNMSPIDFSQSALYIHNQVRGLIPWPCASMILKDTPIKVFKTMIGNNCNAPSGSILQANKNGIEIACGDGKSVILLEIQAEGGKRMEVGAYLAGHPIK